MSFQDTFHDLEAGLPPRPPPPPPQAVVAHSVFQINTKVSELRRLADALGAPGVGGDARALRERIRRTRAEATRLARNTARRLADAGAAAAVGPKLAMDFEAALREFQRVQWRIVEADRQETSVASYRTPFGPPAPSHASHSRPYPNNGAATSAGQHRTTQTQQLVESRRTQELVLLDNEITFNEALVQEREQEILKIQQEINEINEIVRDLAKLVHDQHETIDIVESNLETAAMETSKAHEQISEAVVTQQSSSSMKCLLLTVLGLFMFIVVVLLA
ncbi:syntaxin-22-like [Phragmites australis]|uniref:syntaxin-22-like n=1 Tax=Phragmites australis TaxID=29695 RepID=UPI002D79A924|nr:syntaxin-22-like [Phragmites australis]